MRSVIPLFSLLISVFSCKHDIKPTDLTDATQVRRIDLSLPPNSGPLELSGLLTDVSYCKLGTNPDFLIGDVKRLVLDKDRIYVLDAEKAKGLFVFDRSGRPLFKLCPRAKPGQDMRLHDFSLDPANGHIWLFDMDGQQLLEYDAAGRLLENHKPGFDFYNFSFLPDGALAFHIYKGNNRPDTLNRNELIVTDADFKVRYMAFPTSERFKKISYVFPRSLRAADAAVTFKPDFSDSVFSVTKKGLALRYVVETGKDSLKRSRLNGLDQHGFIRQTIKQAATCFGGTLFETRQTAFFLCNHLFSGRSVFYDRKSGRLATGLGTSRKDSGHFFWSEPIGTDGDYFVGMAPASDIVSSAADLEKNGVLQKNPAMQNVVRTTKPGDNPVLVFYKVKAF